MTGAAVTNIVILGYSPLIPLIYLLIAATIAYFRRPTIRALLGPLRRA